jgi:hypothetical protein
MINSTDDKTLDQGFVEQDTALESMRASDFDCYSAYGEVVDNSIEADATDIRVQFLEKKGARKKTIESIIFADNGHGMDTGLLHKCLKLGHSSRYNDRSGIGRFGVGMTLGAIHECRRIEVYSKISSGSWQYTYLDLDEIKSGELKFLPPPIPKQPSCELANYIKDSGTLVVWSKYDKQVDTFEKIIDETKFWIGRTFRKFIWGTASAYEHPISIKINGERINAFDPLYVTKKNTGYEEEPSAELLKPQVFPWVVPDEAEVDKQRENITINVSLLPDEYRRERGKAGDSFALSRQIDRNEGISILRNDREVFYGHIPFTQKLGGNESDKNVNRFIGCEIAFDAVHDQDFAVKNIKRGAVPVRELKTKIIERLAPTFTTQRLKIRNEWNQKTRDAEKAVSSSNEEIGVSGKHSATNKFLKNTKESLLKNNKANKENNDEKIARKVNPDASETEIAKVIAGLKENGITIDEREFIGDAFIDIEHGNQLKTLIYNTNSTFYKAYIDILNELREKHGELADNYRTLMDLIFVGYMLAEAQIDPEEEIDGAAFADELKQYWALNLSKILKKWNK